VIAYIFGLRECVRGVGAPSPCVLPLHDGKWSTDDLDHMVFHVSLDGIGGDPEDVGEVVVELEEEGASGVVGVGAENA
jgi:hypothetical protein